VGTLVRHSDAISLQAAGAWVAAVGGVGALGYLGYQAKLANTVAILQAHNALTAHSVELNRRFRDDRRLLPYFFEDADVSQNMDPALLWEVVITTDAFADYIEAIALHAALLSSDRFDTWHRFCEDIVSTSPVMRAWLEDNASWYSDETADVLRRGIAKRASRGDGLPRTLFRIPTHPPANRE
jgi:hypothetical protein